MVWYVANDEIKKVITPVSILYLPYTSAGTKTIVSQNSRMSVPEFRDASMNSGMSPEFQDNVDWDIS